MNRFAAIASVSALAGIHFACSSGGVLDESQSSTAPGASAHPSGQGRSTEAQVNAGAPAVGGFAICPADGPYQPLALGNRWTYKVTNPTRSGTRFRIWTKTVEITAKETVPDHFSAHGGQTAFRFETRNGQWQPSVKKWQYQEGTQVVRFAEERGFPDAADFWTKRTAWAPARVRFDESRMVQGMTWNETYTESQEDNFGGRVSRDHTYNWIVVSVDKPCPIAVKRVLPKCIEVNKADASIPNDPGKTYWFARCIGKVMELGRPNEQTEELVDHSVTW